MHTKLFIDGQWQDSDGGAEMAILNPATGQQIAAVPDGSRADVDRAVKAAKTAFYDGRWSRKTPGERSLALFRLADLLEQRGAEIGRIESENAGKPYAQLTMAGDIPFAVDNLRFFAAAARDTHGSRAGEFAAGYTSMFRREPVGVVGQIAPWNYPLLMAVWKLGPALAAGCTVVLKPAPTTPLSALMLAELIQQAGIPDGVVNVVTGGTDTGQALVEHGEPHGLDGHGQEDHGDGRQHAQACPPGAGRQGTGARLRRRRHRASQRQGIVCRHLQYRPGLHRRHARLRGEEPLQRHPRGPCRGDARRQGRHAL